MDRIEALLNEKPVTATPFTDYFTHKTFGMTHPVLKAGDGPGVLLMHEMNGMGPEFWRLAHWLKRAGFTVYVPDLYANGDTPSYTDNIVKGAWRACISREIHLFAKNASSPVTLWLRSLADHMHEACGGPGVGVIGLCMTGNFAWSLMVQKSVIAPVAAEPSLPLGFGKAVHAALHLSEEEQEAVRVRQDVPIIALRFKGDPVCKAARFDALRALAGADRVSPGAPLPDSAKNPKGNSFPHAVLTKDLINEAGQPTREALANVLRFLSERLLQTV